MNDDPKNEDVNKDEKEDDVKKNDDSRNEDVERDEKEDDVKKNVDSIDEDVKKNDNVEKEDDVKEDDGGRKWMTGRRRKGVRMMNEDGSGTMDIWMRMMSNAKISNEVKSLNSKVKGKNVDSEKENVRVGRRKGKRKNGDFKSDNLNFNLKLKKKKEEGMGINKYFVASLRPIDEFLDQEETGRREGGVTEPVSATETSARTDDGHKEEPGC